jgi:hypothetical protein
MRAIAIVVAVLGTAGLAHADSFDKPILYLEGDGSGAPAADAEPLAADISNVIYLNRCVGGCTITKSSSNDSRSDHSWFPDGDATTYNLTEFSHDDATWNAILACVQDVYSAYDVVVTDVDPGDAPHTEVYVAGLSEQIGIDAGGVGGGKSNQGGDQCAAVDNNVAFAFANGYPASAVEYMCGVIGQESGHSFGMPDHVRDCRDPMSYSYYGPCTNGSSERGFFRNIPMQCVGLHQEEVNCRCSGAPNDHAHLINVFGDSGVVPDAPTVSIIAPDDGATVLDTTKFFSSADAHRGIFKAELFLNGWLWATYTTPEHPGPGTSRPVG